jgi:signal transduction histidine kinase
MAKGLKILLLEDVPDDAGLVDRMLQREKLEFVTRRVDTREEFIDALIHFRPDVVLSDHGLPQFNSIEALKLCQEHHMKGPFILVTGTVSEEFAVNCLKQGADDYVLKSNLTRLPSAILQAINKREAEQNKLIAEARLKAQNDDLLLINQKLIKTKAELDNFVYSVSHNLKGPLSSIHGLVNLTRLEDPMATNPFGPYLNMIEKSLFKLNETLDEILDYSRNASGELKIEPLSLKRLTQLSIERFKSIGATDMQISIEEDVVSDFYSDAYRISIILNNIIANAIKYHDIKKSKRFIRITLRIGADAVIQVEDNGIGIQSQYLPLIFNMFYRACQQSEGAGLGLYIAREAVHKLEGTISVKSDLDVGSIFTIVLPNQQPHEGFK